jgi:hypothetical protein
MFIQSFAVAFALVAGVAGVPDAQVSEEKVPPFAVTAGVVAGDWVESQTV